VFASICCTHQDDHYQRLHGRPSDKAGQHRTAEPVGKPVATLARGSQYPSVEDQWTQATLIYPGAGIDSLEDLARALRQMRRRHARQSRSLADKLTTYVQGDDDDARSPR
jgi:hypothetical protein